MKKTAGLLQNGQYDNRSFRIEEAGCIENSFCNSLVVFWRQIISEWYFEPFFLTVTVSPENRF